MASGGRGLQGSLPPCTLIEVALPLSDIQHGYFRDRPAIIGTGYLELHHRDGIRGAAYDAQATTDTFLLVDNHIGATAPGFCADVHGITFDDAREALHTDAVVGTNVHAA